MDIKNEPEFLALAAGASPKDSSSGAELTASDVIDVIRRLGYESLPVDIFNRLSPEEAKRLPEDVTFDIYEKVIAPRTSRMDELWFVPSPLIHSGIPHSDPGTKRQHLTNAGSHATTISVPLSSDPRKLIPLPYGMQGRQVLSMLTTLAVRTESPREVITLPGAKTGFAADLFGVDPNSGRGKRGAINRYAESLVSWVNATVHIATTSEDKASGMYKEVIEPFAIVDKAVYWGRDSFRRAEGVQLSFSSQFLRLASNHSVPIDRSVQMRLARLVGPSSALAYDLYHWAAYRRHKLERPISLTWRQAHDQFLSETASKYSAARAIKNALELLEKNELALPIIASSTRGMMLLPGGQLPGEVEPAQQELLLR